MLRRATPPELDEALDGLERICRLSARRDSPERRGSGELESALEDDLARAPSAWPASRSVTISCL